MEHHRRSQTVFQGTETLGREIFVQRILISIKRFQNIFAVAIDGNFAHRNSKILYNEYH